MTAPDPDGKWAEIAVRGALREAGLRSGQIDVVSAHGTGTPLNDAMEAGLIQRVYGPSDPAVIALKSWIGHVAAACGALELAISLICMQNSYLPEIRNLREACHPEINFVRQETACSFDTLLLENFGFGGQNSALVIRKWTA